MRNQELNDKDFNILVDFVKKNYGINLEGKTQLVSSRLSNFTISEGYNSISEYIQYIINTNNETDKSKMLNLLTTNHTYYMREFSHFEYFNTTVLPYLEMNNKDKVLSIWSAGCSSGEEPYTLSILLKEYFSKKPGKWDTKILATDISQKALSAAKKGTYTANGLKDMPKEWIEKYFIPSSDKKTYTVCEEIRNNVVFKTFNLMEPIKFKRNFDVIFCRNVMIYFDKDTRDNLVNRFYDATNWGGYLFIGNSETVALETTNYKWVMPSGYRKIK